MDQYTDNLNVITNNTQVSSFYDKPFMVLTDRLSVNKNSGLQNF